MGIAMFPDGDPAVANGKLSAELTGIVNGVEHQRSRSSEGRYRPVGTEFAIAPTVSVVIPVKNEARNLPIVF
ncbi:MAG: hypothetical protein QOJ73_673, partial [Streptosporangiaceae bacterium]|nr:hypothetical protein [Streptosporangiaceae bacterium]